MRWMFSNAFSALMCFTWENDLNIEFILVGCNLNLNPIVVRQVILIPFIDPMLA